MSLAVIETNEVHLIGRLADRPVHKTMPSGDAAVTFRLVIRRPPSAARRQAGDSIHCTSFRAAAVRASAGWQPGDVLEVHGAVHRRFWRDGPTTRQVYDIEVARVRRVARLG